MSYTRSWFRNSVFAALAILQMAAWGQCQSGGIIQGQVTDPSGAAIPALSVVAVSSGGARQEVQTNEEGRYIFPNLAPGTYDLQVQLKGLAPFEKPGVVVAAGRAQTIDVRLVVTLEKNRSRCRERASAPR